MEELKPCPFCGGEVIPPDEDDYIYGINHKDECLLKEKYFGIQTIDETRLAAWNTRAERMCHTEEAYGTIGDGSIMDYYKLPRCSECYYGTRFEAHGYKYCPSCGAKVEVS